MILKAQQTCSLPVTQFSSQFFQNIFPLCLLMIIHINSLILIICAGLKSLNWTTCCPRKTPGIFVSLCILLIPLGSRCVFPCNIPPRLRSLACLLKWGKCRINPGITQQFHHSFRLLWWFTSAVWWCTCKCLEWGPFTQSWSCSRGTSTAGLFCHPAFLANTSSAQLDDPQAAGSAIAPKIEWIPIIYCPLCHSSLHLVPNNYFSSKL